MRLLFKILALSVLAVPAVAETRTVTVVRDQPAHLSNPHSWLTGDCVPGWVQITVLLAPRNGEVRVEPIQHEIGDFGGGRLTTGNPSVCLGRMVSGTALFYVPDAGFTGSDRFRVRMEFEHIPANEVDYVLSVQ